MNADSNEPGRISNVASGAESSYRSSRSRADADDAAHNVGKLERAVSLVGGALLTRRGLKRGGLRGMAAAAVGGMLTERGLTGHCRVYDALGIDTAHQLTASHIAAEIPAEREGREIDVEVVTTIGRPASELYEFWRDPSNLPRFMESVESVEPRSDESAEWTLKPPVGPTISFIAAITDDLPNERIAWQSEDTAVVRHTGEVTFEPTMGDRGTAVRLRLHFQPPGGRMGASIARLFDGPMEMRLRADLGRFKQLIETGEIATTDGQPAAR